MHDQVEHAKSAREGIEETAAATTTKIGATSGRRRLSTETYAQLWDQSQALVPSFNPAQYTQNNQR